MPEEKNIKNYSASDIEKYWKGHLNKEEMRAMEKAALDDAFLADAMEGYKNVSSAENDIKLLNENLEERINRQEAKVIPIGGRKIPWLRIAAAVVIVSGIGILASKLVFNKNKSPEIATVQNAETAPGNNPAEPSMVADSATSLLSDSEIRQKPIDQKDKKTENGHGDNSTTEIETSKTVPATANRKPGVPSFKNPGNNSEAIAAAPQKNESAELKNIKEATGNAGSNKIRGYIQDTSAREKKLPEGRNAGVISSNRGNNNFVTLNNSFIGKITDQNNNPVPYANIMNTHDQVGTYSDANGNFNLISSDSVLDLRIKSLGFETQHLKLNASGKTQNITLENDRSTSLEEIVIAKRMRINSPTRQVLGKKAEPIILDEEDEISPEIGWDNYDTYITNNYNLPEDVKKGSGGQVGLSFRIDDNGKPVDIKITKSLCKKCDEEAIRVLKDGPKWNKKGKRSRTNVIIAVDKKQ